MSYITISDQGSFNGGAWRPFKLLTDHHLDGDPQLRTDSLHFQRCMNIVRVRCLFSSFVVT